MEKMKNLRRQKYISETAYNSKIFKILCMGQYRCIFL